MKLEHDVSGLINECNAMTDQLLAICEHPLGLPERKVFSMKQDFPQMDRLAPSQILIPLQNSLTASMSSTSSQGAVHVPFPVNAPTFNSTQVLFYLQLELKGICVTEFLDEIEVMKTLAKPRKIMVRGSDGVVYSFLGKPKDDLRKDARLMDFNAIINKILKATSESRRRQLRK